MQISFLMKKFIFASNEDANQFLIWEKFRSASNEDTDPFFVLKKKFRSTSKEDVDPFYFKKKNLDLHLMKMQIHFILRKKN